MNQGVKPFRSTILKYGGIRVLFAVFIFTLCLSVPQTPAQTNGSNTSESALSPKAKLPNKNFGGSIQTAPPAGMAASGNSQSTESGCMASDLIQDGGFEQNTDTGTNPFWTSTSTNFGISLCTSALCGIGGGTAAPRTGDGWVWFDGIGDGAAESGTAAQSVTIPTGVSATLKYYLRVGFVTAPASSVMTVTVDGNVVETVNEPATAESGYTLHTINLTPYADGGTHVISFNYNRPTSGSFDNWTIDDVSLETVCLYNFQPFYYSQLLQPSQMPYFMDTRAGSNVSVAYSLGGYQGANPYSQPPTSQRISCFDKTPISMATPIQTFPGDPFYNAQYDTYMTIWRTQANYAGTCRRLTLYFNDGTTRTFDYRFN